MACPGQQSVGSTIYCTVTPDWAQAPCSNGTVETYSLADVRFELQTFWACPPPAAVTGVRGNVSEQGAAAISFRLVRQPPVFPNEWLNWTSPNGHESIDWLAVGSTNVTLIVRTWS